MASNARIAADLAKIADLLELTEANPFRIRAYRNAARTVQDAHRPLAERVRAGDDLRELPGIGKDIAAQIARKVEGREMEPLEELAGEVPAGLLEVVRVPGVGPKRARTLWRELGVDGLDALEAAASEGRIAELKGFGAKTQASIIAGVASVRRFAERVRRADAERTVAPLVAWLEADDSVLRLERAGSFRRGRDTIGDVDLLVETSDPERTMERFRAYDDVGRVLGAGNDKSSVTLSGGLQVDLRAVPRESFGAALQYFTGSQAHNVRLRKRAGERDLRLNEYGLWRVGDETRIAGADEAEVYRALDLPWIPPELREDRGEIEAAEADALPTLLERDDLIADLHVHSDWSDGTGDLKTMMRAAKEHGLSVLGFADHGPALRMTGGLDRAKLLRQHEALAELDDAVPGLTVLRGLEVDVHADGSLDLDDEALALLDVVTVSVHGAFDLSEAKQTERLVRAVSHPLVHVLAHPTGRLIGRREGIQVDLHAVIEAAKAHGVALEINANPARLDLNDRWARVALEAGVPLSVASDAHGPEGFAVLEHGVLQARRAWATKERVINAWPLARLRRFLAKEGTDAETASSANRDR